MGRGLLMLTVLLCTGVLAGCGSTVDAPASDDPTTTVSGDRSKDAPAPTGASDCMAPDPVYGGPPDCIPEYDDPPIDEEYPEPEGLPADMQKQVDEMCNKDPTICDPSLDSGYSGPDGP